MSYLFGEKINKYNLRKRIGDLSQIAGAKLYELKDGKAKGMTAIDINTGSGLNFTILPDRAMDLAWATYKGIPLSYISKVGLSNPAYLEKGKFSRNFTAGLLTTCGLTQIGTQCEDDGELLEQHGRINKIPAHNISINNNWINENEYIMKIEGKVRESTLFKENLLLTREIKAKLGENKIVIKDKVRNCGFNNQPFMLLYHFNFGYPLVSKNTNFILPKTKVTPRDKIAEKGIDKYSSFQNPTHNYQEQVFYHELKSNNKGMTFVGLYNKDLGENGIGVNIKFNVNQLEKFIEWKQMGEEEYVVGLEPATWYPEGRAKARRKNELEFIKPGETKNFELELEIVEKEPKNIIS